MTSLTTALKSLSDDKAEFVPMQQPHDSDSPY